MWKYLENWQLSQHFCLPQYKATSFFFKRCLISQEHAENKKLLILHWLNFCICKADRAAVQFVLLQLLQLQSLILKPNWQSFNVTVSSIVNHSHMGCDIVQVIPQSTQNIWDRTPHCWISILRWTQLWRCHTFTWSPPLPPLRGHFFTLSRLLSSRHFARPFLSSPHLLLSPWIQVAWPLQDTFPKSSFSLPSSHPSPPPPPPPYSPRAPTSLESSHGISRMLATNLEVGWEAESVWASKDQTMKHRRIGPTHQIIRATHQIIGATRQIIGATQWVWSSNALRAGCMIQW